MFYKTSTNEFGILSPDGKIIVTYFKPDAKKKYWEEQVKKALDVNPCK